MGEKLHLTHLFVGLVTSLLEPIFTITKELVLANQVHPVGISDDSRARSAFVMA